MCYDGHSKIRIKVKMSHRTKTLYDPTGLYEISITGCWPWLGGLDTEGYGQVQRNHKKQKAHRWVWESMVGPLEPEILLDHKCHNRACVNPDHLRKVTAEQNVFNTRPRGGSSQYKGVYRMPNGSWRAHITHRYKKYNLGCYRDEKQAALVYDRRAMELFGEFAYLNFPYKPYTVCTENRTKLYETTQKAA